jgi:hypothetical protein
MGSSSARNTRISPPPPCCGPVCLVVPSPAGHRPPATGPPIASSPEPGPWAWGRAATPSARPLDVVPAAFRPIQRFVVPLRTRGHTDMVRSIPARSFPPRVRRAFRVHNHTITHPIPTHCIHSRPVGVCEGLALCENRPAGLGASRAKAGWPISKAGRRCQGQNARLSVLIQGHRASIQPFGQCAADVGICRKCA